MVAFFVAFFWDVFDWRSTLVHPFFEKKNTGESRSRKIRNLSYTGIGRGAKCKQHHRLSLFTPPPPLSFSFSPAAAAREREESERNLLRSFSRWCIECTQRGFRWSFIWEIRFLPLPRSRHRQLAANSFLWKRECRLMLFMWPFSSRELLQIPMKEVFAYIFADHMLHHSRS